MSIYRAIVAFQVVLGIPVVAGFLFLPSVRSEIGDPALYAMLRDGFLICAVLFVVSVLAGLLWTSLRPSSQPSSALPWLGWALRRLGLGLCLLGLSAIVAYHRYILGTVLLVIGAVFVGIDFRQRGSERSDTERNR